jgi:hypothetical protein
MVAPMRREQAKSRKDIDQSATLIHALAKYRPLELAAAWKTAWESGPKWREKLESGRARLSKEAEAALTGTLHQAAESRKRRRQSYVGTVL